MVIGHTGPSNAWVIDTDTSIRNRGGVEEGTEEKGRE